MENRETAAILNPNEHPRKPLGSTELIAIALGGMIGGGIFTVLGISVAMIGSFTPIAILIGGIMALLAAYSYVKLGVYYKDEGATYSFYKRTFPKSPFAASLIGWYVVFGYISTIALYAYTFASYAISGSTFADHDSARLIAAVSVIVVFTLVNIWSVKGMGKIEDIMVYSKLIILAIIAFVLINNSQTTLPTILAESSNVSVLSILMVASLTFVAFEGFQLVIHAMNEMENPTVNIPKAIYSSVLIATAIYIAIAVGAILAIPFDDIVQNKEYALAAGADKQLGHWGTDLIVLGALLATSSAINGTLFGASRLMSVIAEDGYFPQKLALRKKNIPVRATIYMSAFAIIMLLIDELELILEFASITFLVVSVLMSFANFKIRKLAHASTLLTLLAMAGLSGGALLIFYYEFSRKPQELLIIVSLYLALTLAALFFSRLKAKTILGAEEVSL